jgi:hypothetical protein
VFSSDFPGVNATTLNGMILYYRLMTKWSGLGDSTESSRMGLSQMPKPATEAYGYSNPLDSWAVCHFMGGKVISNHC